MLPERWQDIIGNIKDNFEVVDSGSESDESDGGTDVEFIEFRGPMGLLRLEFVTRPVVLDKKTFFSNRVGSETKVEYVYSDKEKSHKFSVYKWNEAEDAWIEIENAKSMFNA